MCGPAFVEGCPIALSVFTPVCDLVLEVAGRWAQCCALESYNKLEVSHCRH